MLKEIEVKSRQLLSELLSQSTDLGYYQIQKIIKNRNVKVNRQRVGTDAVYQRGDRAARSLHNGEKRACAARIRRCHAKA